MAKEMKIPMEGCTFWWLHLHGETNSLREIKK